MGGERLSSGTPISIVYCNYHLHLHQLALLHVPGPLISALLPAGGLGEKAHVQPMSRSSMGNNNHGINNNTMLVAIVGVPRLTLAVAIPKNILSAFG